METKSFLCPYCSVKIKLTKKTTYSEISEDAKKELTEKGYITTDSHKYIHRFCLHTLRKNKLGYTEKDEDGDEKSLQPSKKLKTDEGSILVQVNITLLNWKDA